MHKMSEVEKSSVYCHIQKNHEEGKASACLDCCRADVSVSQCRIVSGHIIPAQNLSQDNSNQTHSENL